MTVTEAKSEVFWTAFRALPKKERGSGWEDVEGQGVCGKPNWYSNYWTEA